MIHGLYNVPTVLSDGARLPEKAHELEDAAYDLHASEPTTLLPGTPRLVKTGVSVEIPEGCAGLVLPRSGLALKHGITVMNAPGLIDPGYRGEIGVILFKALSIYDSADVITDGATMNQWITDHGFHIAPGDRIAQLLIVPAIGVTFTPAHALSESGRGVGGFGSTGV